MSVARIGYTVQAGDLQRGVAVKKTRSRTLSLNDHVQKAVNTALETMGVFSHETLQRALHLKKTIAVYTGKFTLVILRIQSLVLAIIIGSDGSFRLFEITREYFHLSPAAKKHGQGIPNIGNSCYLNSLIQVLRTTSSFRSFLDTIDQKTSVKTEQQKLSAALKSLFNKIESTENPLTIKEIEHIFKKTPVLSTHLRRRSQQDAQEFLTSIANTLEWKGFDIQEKDFLSTRFTCPIPKHDKAIDKDAKVITLAIPNNNKKISIQEAINGKVMQREALDEDDIKGMLNSKHFSDSNLDDIKNKYNCDYFKTSKSERIAIKVKEELDIVKNIQGKITRKEARKIFLNAQRTIDKEEDLKTLLNAQEELNAAKQQGVKNPKVHPYTTTTRQMLHIKDTEACIGQTIPIALKRFDYNFNTSQSTKKCNDVIPQREIEIPLTASRRNAKIVARLELQSVIVHHGSSVSSGHYTAYERKGSSFVQYNDRRVIEHTAMPDSVLKEGYIFFYTIKEIIHGK